MPNQYCSKCGAKLRETDRFCPSCGTRVLTHPGESSRRTIPARKSHGSFIFGVVVLLAIVGFIWWLVTPSPTAKTQPSGFGLNEELPPGHPPIDSDSSEASQGTASGEMPPFVMQRLSELRRKIDENPDDVDSRLELAGMYYQIGRFEQALEYLDGALRVDPQNYDALVMAGNACYDSEQYERAISYYSRALAIKPDDVSVRTDMGTMYLHKGDADGAIREFKRALSVKDDFIPALTNLAEAYTVKNEKDLARKTLEEALQKAHTEDEKADIKRRIDAL